MFTGLPKYRDHQQAPWKGLPSIPQTWRWRRLASLGGQVKNTGRPDLPLLSVYLSRGVIPYAEGARRVHAPSEKLDGYQVVTPGDLVLNNQQAWRGSVGVSAHAGIISPAYIVWRLSTTLDPRFAAYLFPSRPMVDQFVLASRGVGDIQRDVHGPSLRNVAVPIPSEAEQVAISKYLAAADTRIAKAISAKTRLVALLLEERAVSADNELNVGDGGRGDAHANRRLKAVLREVGSRSTDGSETHLSMSQRYGLVPARQVRRTLTAESMAGGRLCEAGDIVLNRLKAHLGVFAVAPEAGVVSADYTVLRVVSGDDPEYICEKLRSGSVRPELRRRTKGIVEGFWRLYTPDLLEMHLPFPDPMRQREIVHDLKARKGEVQAATQKIEREIALIREFRDRLKVGVLTGQIDVRQAAASLPDVDLTAVCGQSGLVEDADSADFDDVVESSEG